MRKIPVEAEYKIQIPAEWAEELGLKNIVMLEKMSTGIMVRPCYTLTWDEIFAKKLTMGQQVFAMDLSEVSGDDLLFNSSNKLFMSVGF
jgi:bifunctional DNA-binding transcriptional regulator/antitoxin component of YhaV-PrlF toxin-antitoxin module